MVEDAAAADLLRSFFMQGGVCIEARAGDAILCKTLIQLDGDVVTWLCPAGLSQPTILEQHQRAVQQRLRDMAALAERWPRELARLAHATRWGGGLLGVLANVAAWQALASALLHVLLLALSGAAWHFGTRFAAQRALRRVLRRFAS